MPKMRNILVFILVLGIFAASSACQNRRVLSQAEDLPDPVYTIRIPDSVENPALIDAFYQSADNFFRATYPDLQYSGFMLETAFSDVDTVDGPMQIQFLATKSESLMKNAVSLVARYQPFSREVSFYVDSAADGPDTIYTPVSSQRFDAMRKKLEQYLQSLGVQEGFLRISEHPEKGYWQIEHMKSEAGTPDLSLQIKADTLELSSFQENP